MAKLRPFQGLRPHPDYVKKVASVPYDVVNRKEAAALAADNPYSFLHIVRSEIDFPETVSPYDEKVYDKARENLDSMIASRILIQDEKPAFYLYTLESGAHRQAGIFATVSCEEYQQGIIRKHEFTRQEKEADRVRHISNLEANTGPVLLTYPARQDIDRITEEVAGEEPEYDFGSDDGVRHTVHKISRKEHIAGLQEAFAEIPVLYIADGHHRSAAATRYFESEKCDRDPQSPCSWFMAVLFPHTTLRILPYNRVVRDLNGYSREAFLAELEKNFRLEQVPEPKVDAKGVMAMYLGGNWFRLEYRGQLPESRTERLDVAILQNSVLEPLLGIGNPRSDDRIHFVGGSRGNDELVRLVDSRDYELAFALYPTGVEELMGIADAHGIMPPKSTWFDPKLASGILIHLLRSKDLA